MTVPFLPDLLDNVARTRVRSNSGADVAARRRLNFVDGDGSPWTLTDSGVNEEVLVSVNGAITNRAPTGSVTVPANSSFVVVQDYEIATGQTLELAANATMEIL